MGINYKENNQWKEVKVKVGDNIQVGTIVEFDGQTIPVGWEEISEDISSKITFNTGLNVDLVRAVKYGDKVTIIGVCNTSTSFTANAPIVVASLDSSITPIYEQYGLAKIVATSQYMAEVIVTSTNQLRILSTATASGAYIFNITYFIS